MDTTNTKETLLPAIKYREHFNALKLQILNNYDDVVVHSPYVYAQTEFVRDEFIRYILIKTEEFIDKVQMFLQLPFAWEKFKPKCKYITQLSIYYIIIYIIYYIYNYDFF